MDKREGLFHLTLTLVRRIDERTVALAQRGISHEATTLTKHANDGLQLAEDLNNLPSDSGLEFEKICKRFEEFRKVCQ